MIAFAAEESGKRIIMKEVNIKLNRQIELGTVKRELFSSFVEHIGRAVFGGIYQPDHPTADADGFRKDVIDLVRELNVPYIRYPGGNFVSGYQWKNGIGPKNARPALPDLAWMQMELNAVGVDEFMKWTAKVGAKPIMAVNLGTGTPQEAFELLQYCNGTTGYWAELRKKNGREEPYRIEYWCIGNEMDGEWQIGHKTADEYAKIAKMTAKMMKLYDPTVKLIFCGSSSFEMPTFPAWDETVIETCFEELDYISCHRYYSYDKKKPEGRAEFMGASVDFDRGIRVLEKIIDRAKKRRGSEKHVGIALDEWNVWYMGEGSDLTQLWTVGAAREENIYSALDAVVFASLIGVIVNHAKTVDIACLAQLVNVIAPIYTANDGGAVKQSIFDPFRYASRELTGTVYGLEIDCDRILAGKYGEVPGVTASFVEGETGARLWICNLSEETVSVSLRGQGGYRATSRVVLIGSDEKNTIQSPDCVRSREEPLEDQIIMAPRSWNLVRYSK